MEQPYRDVPFVQPGSSPLGLVEIVIPRLEETLVERVRQIVKFWGEDEGVEMERVIEVASRLYGADPSDVVEALIENLRAGSVRGSFVVNAASTFPRED